MKAAKIVAFVVGGIVLLVLLVGAIALVPGVQTWAVRKAVADQPGLKLEVARVSAGFSAADVRELRVVKDGMVITAKGVTANYSAWDYIAQKRINADQVTIDGLVVDLRGMTRAAAAGTANTGNNNTAANAKNGQAAGAPARTSLADAARAKFNGALAQAQLPFDVRVARLTINGRALLTDHQSVVFTLQGANIATGQRGQLELKADLTDTTKAAPVAAAHIAGTVGVRITADRRIDLAEVDATLAAEGPQLPTDRIKLEARAEQPKAGGDEAYAATIALLRGNAAEPLLKAEAQFRTATHDFAGAWNVSVRSEQLAAVLAGFGLPELAANGAGKFTLNPDTGALTATGDLQANISRLEKIAAELAQIGAVQVRAAFDGGLADNVARLERLQVDVTARDGRRIAQVSTTQRVGFSLESQRVTLANPQAELARLSVQALPLAWAQPFVKDLAIDSGELSLSFAVEAEPDGSRIRARALEPLGLRAVTLRQQDKKLVEQLTLTASPRLDYSAERVLAEIPDLKIALPAGDAIATNLSATVTNLKATPAIAFTVETQAKIVAALKPYLPLDPGPLALAQSVQGRLAGDVLTIAKSSTTVQRDGGALLASVEVQQPVTANLKAATFTVPNPQATAARVKLGEVPLAWAQAFVPDSQFAGGLAGATLELSCRSLDDVTLNTTEPVALRGIGATLAGKPLVKALDVTADLTATKRGEVVAYEVRRIEVKQGATSLLGLVVAGEARLGGKFSVIAKGTLEADAAALMQQPAAAAFATLSRGKVTSTFDANITDTIQAKATLAARGLVAKQNNQVLGDLEVSLTATMKADGSGTVIAPITMSNPQRKSDLAVEGAFGKSADQKSFLFTGKIASNQIFVDDFQPLAALAPADQPAAAAPANRPAAPTATRPAPTSAPRSGTPAATAPGTASTGPGGRDQAPFWQGAQGKVTVDLKRIVYGKDYVISGVRGTAVVTESKLSLDGLEGRFKENPFKLAGGVQFAAKAAKPYTLTASADVQNLDIGEILRAAAPNEKPVFETKATLSAQLHGTGLNVVDLGKNAYGRFELTGKEGITRLLAKKGGASTAVKAASLGLAILGAVQKNEGTAAALGASSELIRLLDEVHFDSVKVQVERAPDLSFKITSIDILAQGFLHASGTGTVASKSTDDIANAPMNIQLQLGAKEAFAYALQKGGLLSGKQDAQGFYQMTRDFTIGGTPSKPDNSALWSLLLQVGLGAFR